MAIICPNSHTKTRATYHHLGLYLYIGAVPFCVVVVDRGHRLTVLILRMCTLYSFLFFFFFLYLGDILLSWGFVWVVLCRESYQKWLFCQWTVFHWQLWLELHCRVSDWQSQPLPVIPADHIHSSTFHLLCRTLDFSELEEEMGPHH